jgi:hypothetical protein
VSYNKIGDVLVAQGNLPEAQTSFRYGLAIAERLAKADPGNAEWQRDLSVCYNKIGNVLVAQGNLLEATGWRWPTPAIPHGRVTCRCLTQILPLPTEGGAISEGARGPYGRPRHHCTPSRAISVRVPMDSVPRLVRSTNRRTERLRVGALGPGVPHLHVPQTSLARTDVAAHFRDWRSILRRQQVVNRSSAESEGQTMMQQQALDPAPRVDAVIVRAAIHPAIGVARIGDSENEFFIGPEVVDPVPEPPEFYRDAAGALKRQAARFRTMVITRPARWCGN